MYNSLNFLKTMGVKATFRFYWQWVVRRVFVFLVHNQIMFISENE